MPSTEQSLRESLRQLQIDLQKLINQIQDKFDYKQECYQLVSNAIKTIKENTSQITLYHQDHVTFILGSTGSGKSTTVNYLATSDDNFIVKNNDNEITTKTTSISKIGGQHATTLFPVLYSHQNESYLDCAGDGDTGGIIIEIINSIIKMKLASKIKKAKIIFVTQYSTLKGASGYGSAFKSALEKNIKFIGDFNLFRDSIGFVVTCAPTKPFSLENAYDSTFENCKKLITNVMNHPDMVCYQEQISNIVENGKIALFSQASSSLNINDTYSPPQWNTTQRQKMIDMIQNIPYVDIPAENLFRTATSPEMREMMRKLFIVVEAKVIKIIENIIQNAKPIEIYTVELQIFAKFLNQLMIGKETNLIGFFQILKLNNFLKIKIDSNEISHLNEQIIFLTQFISETHEPEFNWSHKSNLSNLLSQAYQNAQKLLYCQDNYFLKEQKEGLIQTKYLMRQFAVSISEDIIELDRILRQLVQILLLGKQQSSHYYKDSIRKQFSHKVSEPYEERQKYLRPEQYQEWVQATFETYYENVLKSRPVTNYRQETYEENQIEYKTVTKTRTQSYYQTVKHRNRVFGIVVSPTYSQEIRYRQVPYQQTVPEVKIITKKRQVPYVSSENYYQSVQKVREKVARHQVTKQRKVEDVRQVTRYRQKDIYNDVTIRVLDEQKYNADVAKCQDEISRLKAKIMINIEKYPTQNDRQYKRPNIQIKDEIEEKYKDLLEMWRDAEYRAYFVKNPNNVLGQI